MRILFLDDDKHRHDRFRENNIGRDITHVWTADEAIEALEKGGWDLVFFDRDLSELASMGLESPEERTGETVVKHLIGKIVKEKWPKQVIVHSLNEYAANRMVADLKEAGIPTRRIPWTKLTWLTL